MSSGLSVDVKAIGILEVALVAIGGGQHHEKCAPDWHRLVLEADILGCDVPSDMRARWLEAEEFFDRDWDKGVIVDEFLALIGVLGQHLTHPPEQSTRGFHASTCDDRQEDQQFLLGQPTRSPGLVLELDVE
jgi:hypothetical protein